LKCRELKKNKKNRKYCGFFAVRMRTAKWPRGAYLCGLGAGWCVALVALPCGLETQRTAKNAAGRTAKRGARQSRDARQCSQARQRATAHGNVLTHGNGVGARQYFHARQSGNTHDNDTRTRQRLLPCVCG
jgi:hypothetical protein